MSRFFAVVLAILVSATAHAGLAYRFDSTSSSGPSMSGRVSAEPGKTRIEIEQGDGMLFKSGSVVVSTGGGVLNVLDPAAKTYYTMDVANLLASAGGALSQFRGLVDIDVRNPRVSVRDGGAGPAMEKHATRRSIVDSSYDLTIAALGTQIPARIETHTEIWSTAEIPAELATVFQGGGLRTGIEALDKIVASQTASLKGFPLKQVTTTRISFDGNTSNSTTTTVVSGIREGSFAPGDFAVPDGYNKTESPVDSMLKQFGR